MLGVTENHLLAAAPSGPFRARPNGSPWLTAARLLALGALAAAPYGAATGSWHECRLAFYAAVKMPLMLLATWVLVLPFGIVLTRALGWSGPVAPLAEAAARTIFGTGLALLALTPVNLFFSHTITPPEQMSVWAYRWLYLAHLGVVAAAGLVASTQLARYLRARLRAATLAHLAWVAVFAFVAGEVSWVLRPFIGNPFSPVTFVRSDAFNGNAYEMIFRDVLPALAR